MKKSIISALILSLPLLANAAPGSDPLADQYFSNNEPSLTPQEQAAIGIGQKWQTGAGSVTSKPFAGPDGAISYVYTTGQTQIVCAVLQLCDIALQPGENVNNIDVGDPRVTVSPSITGSGATQQLHLIIKPLDVGLDTSLVVTTDRRTYRMRVKTSRTKFMPYVSFTYPEDAKAKWDAIRTREAKQLRDNTIPQTGEYLGNLDFNYKISGSASWKPVRVYNDGVKTIIQFPKTISSGETPILLVVRKEGGLFSKDETQMVNLRTQGDRTIVDGLFDKAYLVIGVGSSQEKVTICPPTRLLASQTKLVYAALIKDQCTLLLVASLYSAFSWRTLPINEPTKACQIRQKQLFSVGAAEIPRQWQWTLWEEVPPALLKPQQHRQKFRHRIIKPNRARIIHRSPLFQ